MFRREQRTIHVQSNICEFRFCNMFNITFTFRGDERGGRWEGEEQQIYGVTQLMFTSDVFCNRMDIRQRPMTLCYTLCTVYDPPDRFLCNYLAPLLLGDGQLKKDCPFPETSAKKITPSSQEVCCVPIVGIDIFAPGSSRYAFEKQCCGPNTGTC